METSKVGKNDKIETSKAGENKTQDVDALKSEILKIQNDITTMEQLLEFKQQHLLFVGISQKFNIDLSIIYKTIDDLSIELDEESLTWCIRYKHHTDKYNPQDYAANNDQSDNEDDNLSDGKEIDVIYKETEVRFGYNKKYFLRGGDDAFLLYKNSNGKLRIINQHYQDDLDPAEQASLINQYSENSNIAEYIALKIFLFMINNNWTDSDFIKYMCNYIA